MWRVVIRATLTLCAGCATAFPAGPRQGGARWTELTSEHFTVWTDGEPSRVYALIRGMEAVHHVTARIAYPTAPSSGRALAIVLRDDHELSAVNNHGEPRAFADPATRPLWQPMVVLSLTSSEHRLVAHELTHLVSSAVIHHQPRWLAEAMAAYFESMQLAPDRTTVTLGSASLRYGSTLRLVPVRELFGWGAIAPAGHEFRLYYTAWALFAFLINEHPNELAHYLWLVDRAGDPPRGARQLHALRAWAQGFPSLPIDQVDGALEHWLSYGHHMELRFYVNPKDSPVTARRLGDADAYAIRALILGGASPAQRSRARAELAEALAIDPTNVLARVLEVEAGQPLTADVARSLTAAHPEDWRAWWLATTVLPDAAAGRSELGADLGDELGDARARACTLIAQNPALVAPPRLCPDRSAGEPPR